MIDPEGMVQAIAASNLLSEADKIMDKLPEHNISPSAQERWKMDLALTKATIAIGLCLSVLAKKDTSTTMVFDIKEEEDDNQG